MLPRYENFCDITDITWNPPVLEYKNTCQIQTSYTDFSKLKNQSWFLWWFGCHILPPTKSNACTAEEEASHRRHHIALAKWKSVFFNVRLSCVTGTWGKHLSPSPKWIVSRHWANLRCGWQHRQKDILWNLRGFMCFQNLWGNHELPSTIGSGTFLSLLLEELIHLPAWCLLPTGQLTLPLREGLSKVSFNDSEFTTCGGSKPREPKTSSGWKWKGSDVSQFKKCKKTVNALNLNKTIVQCVTSHDHEKRSDTYSNTKVPWVSSSLGMSIDKRALPPSLISACTSLPSWGWLMRLKLLPSKTNRGTTGTLKFAWSLILVKIPRKTQVYVLVLGGPGMILKSFMRIYISNAFHWNDSTATSSYISSTVHSINSIICGFLSHNILRQVYSVLFIYGYMDICVYNYVTWCK